ncbi:MAG: hypothetical protein GY865_19195, partial [candidate division Zixibacteria bacterium]|nr:hypothetical protein [candidate division Zixibacteria bacterium]
MPMRIIFNTLSIALIVLITLFNIPMAAAETVNYTYDNMNHLAQITYEDTSADNYIYDLLGNRLSRHRAVPSSPANTPPNVPSLLTPTDNATDIIAFDITLSWIGGDSNAGDVVVYDVYCDTVNPPTRLFTRTADTSIDIDRLSIEQTYYWKVIARDSRNGVTEGPVWQFTTINTPPQIPSYNLPLNNSAIVPDNVYLSWQEAIDRDTDDTIVDYDIYFGTSATPPLFAANQTELFYPLGVLAPSTVYYWKILARDNHGNTSIDSPVWTFTTLDHSATILTDETFSQDTTLTVANGPYTITNNATVSAGTTLTIEPGTILKFENGACLVVNGNLSALGTPTQPIIFTSSTDDRYGGDTKGDGNTTIPVPGDWTGIQFIVSSSNRALNMSNCQVFFADNGLSVIAADGNSATVNITDSTITQSVADGINIAASGGAIVTLAIDGSALTQNGGRGLYAYSVNAN